MFLVRAFNLVICQCCQIGFEFLGLDKFRANRFIASYGGRTLKVYYYDKHVGLQFVPYLFERLDSRLFHLTSVILFFVYKISWIGEQSEQSDWLLMAAISNYLWANWIHSCLRQFLCFILFKNALLKNRLLHKPTKFDLNIQILDGIFCWIKCCKIC